MAEFKGENGVCLVCHPKRCVWIGNIWYSTDLDDDAQYTSLCAELLGDELTIVAHGDDDACYCPKFCPECGRRLKGEG